MTMLLTGIALLCSCVLLLFFFDGPMARYIDKQMNKGHSTRFVLSVVVTLAVVLSMVVSGTAGVILTLNGIVRF